MTDIQQTLLNILKWFHEVCVNNDLRYFAIGGTLLGAVRHRGFIPWDDDIDLGMPRPDYNKLIELLEHKNGRYVLETPLKNKDYTYQYCKVYDTQTTLIEHNRYKTKRGVFLDIFPFDGIGRSEQESKLNFKEINRKNNYIMTKVCALSGHRKLYKNLAIIASRIIPSRSWRKTARDLDELCASREYDDYEFVANLYGNWHEREIVKREWMGEPTFYTFEDMQVYGPQNADAYLTAVYGNYMQLPPAEKQKSHHDYIKLDLNESYVKE